jgi:hypothetical protein
MEAAIKKEADRPTPSLVETGAENRKETALRNFFSAFGEMPLAGMRRINDALKDDRDAMAHWEKINTAWQQAHTILTAPK